MRTCKFSDYGQKFLLTTNGREVMVNANGSAMPADIDLDKVREAIDLITFATSRIKACSSSADLNNVLLRVYAHSRDLVEQVCIDKRDKMPYIYVRDDGSLLLKKFEDSSLREVKNLALP